MILWGMGICQHVHGTDNARCLIALTLMTGQIGRPGTGLHPLARAEQRAGRLRLGADPDGVPRLPAGRRSRARSKRFEELWGAEARPQARPDRGRDHERRQGGQDPRHVHHGREPGDVRPGPRPRARGDGEPRAPRGAGHLPDRDRLHGRRGAAGDRVPGEERQLHQHRPHGAAGEEGDRAAGRGARGPLDHRRAGEAAGPRVVVRNAARGVRGDAQGHELDRGHHLGAPRARLLGDLPLRERGRPGRAGGVRHPLPDRHRAGRSSSPPT